jgi:hypothetical protein
LVANDVQEDILYNQTDLVLLNVLITVYVNS